MSSVASSLNENTLATENPSCFSELVPFLGQGSHFGSSCASGKRVQVHSERPTPQLWPRASSTLLFPKCQLKCQISGQTKLCANFMAAPVALYECHESRDVGGSGSCQSRAHISEEKRVRVSLRYINVSVTCVLWDFDSLSFLDCFFVNSHSRKVGRVTPGLLLTSDPSIGQKRLRFALFHKRCEVAGLDCWTGAVDNALSKVGCRQQVGISGVAATQ